MTGQVKEDLISRWGELGVVVAEGRIRFQPDLLRESEFLSQATEFTYYDVLGNQQTLPLAAEELAFTYCQVPIIYRLSSDCKILIRYRDGALRELVGLEIDRVSSEEIFSRDGKISSIGVALTPGL
jgi:hypothetical protein